MKRLGASLSILLCWPLLYAQEQILSFHSDIVIAVDGSMEVTETLLVNAEGQQIQRGIFRDFPTRYRDRLGNDYRVEFELLQATRDGAIETARVESLGNGVRIYLGNGAVLLAPGEYEYQLRYRSSRQLGFFADHDELFWNVTGNGWVFPIVQASARVSLPSEVPATAISAEAFTGRFGANGQDYTSTVEDGLVRVSTTAALPPQAGLTLAVAWPKGVVSEPTAIQRLQYTVSDNRGLLFALLAFLASALYLCLAWQRVGRDPDSGVIFPEYAPPAGYSPAAARYISRMQYDNQTFTTALVNLAVKRHITIEKRDKTHHLRRSQSSAPLAAGEAQLLKELFQQRSSLQLDVENYATLQRAMKAHRRSLRRDYLNVYFARNSGFLLPSAVLSIVLCVVTLVSGAMVISAGLIFAANLFLHGLFAYLLQAPSVKGRVLMDKLERFKLYLSVAEQDELKSKYPPEKTPELFESFLPYAIALGVEEAWANQFTEAFASLQAETGLAYQPLWYQGEFDPGQLGNFTNNMANGMNSAIASSVTAPGSTSGIGGGGFSGGGGGGGGGGGW